MHLMLRNPLVLLRSLTTNRGYCRGMDHALYL